MEIEMVERERIVTRRPGRCAVFGPVGASRPLSRRFGRTLLPPHWTAKRDADALAEIREDAKMMEEWGGYCPLGPFFW